MIYWQNHFVVGLLLAFHYWTLCIDDNLVQQPIQGISDIANKKNTKFSRNKRLFVNFYKTNDYFFDLIIKTKNLCAQYICSWETPEACSQRCSSKRTNTFLEEHRRGTASGAFGNVLHYFFAISPFFQKQSSKRNFRSSLSDVFFKKSEHLLRRTHLEDCFWNSWNSSPLFSVCSVLLLPTFLADIFQVLFTYCVITVFATHFDFGEFIFVFFILFLSSYFFNANVTPISVTSILHTNVCYLWLLCYLQNFTHFYLQHQQHLLFYHKNKWCSVFSFHHGCTLHHHVLCSIVKYFSCLIFSLLHTMSTHIIFIFIHELDILITTILHFHKFFGNTFSICPHSSY